MKKKHILILAVALLVFVFGADAASAAWSWGDPLVPCGIGNMPRCKPCDLYALLKNLLDFVLLGLMPVGAGLLFTLAGFYTLTGGAVPANLQKGKTIFTSTAMAIAVISGAWLITNTIIVNLAKGTSGADSTTSWYTVQCTDPIDAPASLPPINFVPAEQCKMGKDAVARSFGVSNPGQSSSTLQSAINCLLADEEIERLRDKSQPVYTKDIKYDWCNYTKGLAVCSGACSHSVGCHYAGASGTGFVEGADFNAAGGSEYELCRAITRKAKDCGDIDFVNFEGDHTHISTKACTGDQGQGKRCY